MSGGSGKAIDRNRIWRLARRLYNRSVREHLPDKVGVYNGVAVREPAFLDVDVVVPDHKEGTVSAVREHVQEGDTVVEVGSGYGVCTTWAALQAGPDGSVVSFDAAAEQAETARETVRLNGVADRVQIQRGIVGSVKDDNYGTVDGAPTVAFDDLPDCDVILSDAEGAESEFVDRVADLDPRVAIIETHGHRGAPTDMVIETLEAQRYSVVSANPAMVDSPHDNCAVVGVRR